MFVYFRYLLSSVFSKIKKAFIVVSVFSIIIALFVLFNNSGEQNFNNNSTNYKKELYSYLQSESKDINEEYSKISMAGIMCFFVGEGCTNNPNESYLYKDKSLIGLSTNILVAPIKYPQASGFYSLQQTLAKAHIIPQAYAAEGIGFASLKPFIGIWLLFRNLVYLLFVIIIVAIGFMIMFRTKINPQTVISVENSIPKIVIALLLVTFSYPIVGFLIDLMYVSIGLVLLLISTYKGGVAFTPDTLKDMFIFGKNKYVWDIINPIKESSLPIEVFSISSGIVELIPAVIRRSLDVVAGNLLFRLVFVLFSAIPAIGPSVSKFMLANQFKFLKGLSTLGKSASTLQQAGKADVGVPLGSITIMVLGLILEYILAGITSAFALKAILWIIFMASLAFIILRLTMMLFSTYVSILTSLIFSPIILALEAIPGKSSFGSWFKNLILNLATFPIMITLILVSAMIINLPSNSPDVKLWQPPLLFGFETNTFYSIIGGLILFSIPDLIKSIKEMTGVKPLPISLSAGSMFAGATSLIGGGVGMLSQFSSIGMGLSQVKGLANIGKPPPANPLADLPERLIQAIQTQNAPQAPSGGSNQQGTPG